MGERPAQVRRHDDGGVATLTLSRPDRRNALSLAMLIELVDLLAEVGADRSVRVVVLAGEGPAFCAGHDLRELVEHPDPAFRATLFERCSRLMLSIVGLPQPVIAKVAGIATAAGCQLVATCDLAVAAASARFATPGVDIGLFCSTPMVALTRTVGAKHAMEMLLTGELVDADHAARIGLVNRVVLDADLDRVVDDLAATIAAKPPAVVALGKEALHRQAHLGLADAYRVASEAMAANLDMADADEGIDAFLTKRIPTWAD